MAVTHVQTAPFGSGAATSLTRTFVIPANAVIGNLLIVSFNQQDTTGTFTLPAGWTAVNNWAAAPFSSGNVTTGKACIAWKVCASGDPGATRTLTSSVNNYWQGFLMEVSGADATNPIPSVSTNSGTMSTTSLVMATLSPAVADTMIAAYTVAGVASLTHTYPAGMTEQGDSSSRNFASQSVGTEPRPTAGSTSTRTITVSASVATWLALGIVIVPAAAAATTLTQSTFRGRNDDGSETTATWKAVAGTDWTQAVDTNFRVRFNISDSVAAATQNTAFVLRYSLNGGAYTAVSGASSVVRATASPNITDGVATTEQLAGAGTFNAGTIDEVDGSATGFTAATATGQDTEVEYVAQIRSADVVDGDTINLRVYLAAAAIDAYTDTPVITVSEPPPPAEPETINTFQPITFY